MVAFGIIGPEAFSVFLHRSNSIGPAALADCRARPRIATFMPE
jgi:hypothetical protein